jgi:hypothetical protein
VAERIVALTLAEPPGETTHWTGRAMAKVTGVNLSYVQRVWRSHGLQPHRIRTFKLSTDPQFAAKVRDIVTPTSASWLNAVEGFFAVLTKRRLKRGTFVGIVDLQAAINGYVADHNTDPKPSDGRPDKIIAAAARGHQTLDSIH